MRTFSFAKKSHVGKVSGVVSSQDLNMNDIVIKKKRGKGDVEVFRRLPNGHLKQLKRIRSVEKGKNELHVATTNNPETTKSPIPTTPMIETMSDSQYKRLNDWLKFRNAVLKTGSLKSYMAKSEHDETYTILTKRPDFIRGMKLYEGGSSLAWQMLATYKIETVRNLYARYYLDADMLLAA